MVFCDFGFIHVCGPEISIISKLLCSFLFLTLSFHWQPLSFHQQLTCHFNLFDLVITIYFTILDNSFFEANTVTFVNRSTHIVKLRAIYRSVEEDTIIINFFIHNQIFMYEDVSVDVPLSIIQVTSNLLMSLLLTLIFVNLKLSTISKKLGFITFST